MTGSARSRRRQRHAWRTLNLCGCWHCTPGKVKKALAASDKRAKRRSITESHGA